VPPDEIIAQPIEPAEEPYEPFRGVTNEAAPEVVAPAPEPETHEERTLNMSVPAGGIMAIAKNQGNPWTLLLMVLVLGGMAALLSTGIDPFKATVRAYKKLFPASLMRTPGHRGYDLKLWVRLARQNGFDDQYIERFLRTHGWKEDVVQSIIGELSGRKVSNEKMAAWYSYFAEHMRLGHTLNGIQRNLLHLGYERSVIEYLVRSYEQEMTRPG
jgi:hypothetical protein